MTDATSITMKSPGAVTFLTAQVLEPRVSTPAEFAATIKQDITSFSDLSKSIKARS